MYNLNDKQIAEIEKLFNAFNIISDKKFESF